MVKCNENENNKATSIPFFSEISFKATTAATGDVLGIIGLKFWKAAVAAVTDAKSRKLVSETQEDVRWRADQAQPDPLDITITLKCFVNQAQVLCQLRFRQTAGEPVHFLESPPVLPVTTLESYCAVQGIRPQPCHFPSVTPDT